METSAERRRSPRRRVPVLVARGPAFVPFGCTRDLSETGMFVSTAERPGVGLEDDVHMNWGHDVVSCRARVVRHGDDGVGLTFLAGDSLFRYVLGELLS